MKRTYTLNFILALLMVGFSFTAQAQVDCSTEYGDNYFWGTEAGQGDFSDGFGDWETISLNENQEQAFVIVEDTAALPIEYGFFGTATPFTAATAKCGYAHMPFLKYNIDDNDGQVTIENTYVGELISPVIDCSDKQYVSIEYSQAHNRLNFQCGYQFSTDGGETWSEEAQLPYEGAVNRVVDNRRVSIALPAFDGEANCRFKFIGRGDAYYLSIDDVTFKEDTTPDLAADPGWTARALHYGTPASQVMEMPFMCDVNNRSAKPSSGSVMTATIYDEEGNQLFQSTQEYGTIRPGSEDGWNIVHKNTFTPPAEEGTYFMEYVIKDEEDLNPSNDTVTSSFLITSNQFMKVIAPNDIQNDYLSRNQIRAELGSVQGYGTMFNISEGGRTLDSVRVGFSPMRDDEAFTAGSVYLDIYSWVDIDGNGAANVTASGTDEKTRVGGTEYTVLSSTPVEEAEDLVLFPVDDEDLDDDGDDEDPIELEDNTNYIAMLTFEPFSEGKFYQIMYNSRDVNRIFDDLPVEYALDTLEMRDRNASVLYYANSYDEIKSVEIAPDRGFGSFFVNVFTNATETSSEDIKEDLGVNVYPTVANERFTVELNLEEGSDNVMLELVDINGKVVSQDNYSNVQKGKYYVPVNGIASGNYLLNVRTDDGMKSHKVIVVQ